ncbi:hypothetical protein Q5P01_017304 [Channa striata]|uniref:Uncharacterized protein n=1 Tax=Channa striata TaxID=64152 RepID=A0AA88M9A5_CHASR|nr:hypothetical protein Q5P01_017304 [Channa striata]
MEDSLSFNMDTDQMDDDYENLGEDLSGQDSVLQFVSEPAASEQRFPETLHTEVFRESTETTHIPCGEVVDEDCSKKTPSTAVEDSLSFDVDVSRVDAEFENLGEDAPGQESFLQVVTEPTTSTQRLQEDVSGESTDVADEDCSRKTPSRTVEDSLSFNMDISQTDSDYENLGDDAPGQESFPQLVTEPVESPQRLQMDVFWRKHSRKTPSGTVEDSLSFNMDISQTDSDYENLGEDEPGQVSFLQLVREPSTSTQRLQMDVFGENTDVADEGCSKKTPLRTVEDSLSFNMDISQTDSDYENLGEDAPGQESFLQVVREPATSTQMFPETQQMDFIRECTDVAVKDCSKKTPSRTVEDFNIDICQTDSDYENLGEDAPGQESFLQVVREPTTSRQRLQMDVFGESTDVADEGFSKKTPSRTVKDSLSFNIDICQTDSDYE